MHEQKVIIYGEKDIAGIRRAAQASAEVLGRLCEAVSPGMSTFDLDMLAKEFIKETGGTSAFFNYHGYPGQICVSVNDEVVHGIGRPTKIIQPGDLVSLDVGVTIGGYVGDNARTVCAGGTATGEGAHLMDVTRQALKAGILRAREGNCVNDIGAAVQRVVEDAGFHVVVDMVGHGCGKIMHEPPEVPNFRCKGKTPALKAGMVICIEPMVNVGTSRIVIDRNDRWTARTADGSLSAHFENQILITKDAPEILSVWQKTM